MWLTIPLWTEKGEFVWNTRTALRREARALMLGNKLSCWCQMVTFPLGSYFMSEGASSTRRHNSLLGICVGVEQVSVTPLPCGPVSGMLKLTWDPNEHWAHQAARSWPCWAQIWPSTSAACGHGLGQNPHPPGRSPDSQETARSQIGVQPTEKTEGKHCAQKRGSHATRLKTFEMFTI